ncbi:MAG: biotin--[acetyl-CoA-carboxylase] ligase [Lewinellaceae bacterium]|nr:biotin--[acetyl-CoA-carboxylase] ligase [Lewinellaceae bacterium]
MANTLFIGKVYHRFDALPSTNDYARELLAKSKPPEGTVLRAASQSAGRGQYGSRWLSAAGQNLTLSIILYPKWLQVAEQFRLSEAVALAVRDTVVAALPHASGAGVLIKWPNDVYLSDRKIAGILIQNALNGLFAVLHRGHRAEHKPAGVFARSTERHIPCFSHRPNIRFGYVGRHLVRVRGAAVFTIEKRQHRCPAHRLPPALAGPGQATGVSAPGRQPLQRGHPGSSPRRAAGHPHEHRNRTFWRERSTVCLTARYCRTKTQLHRKVHQKHRPFFPVSYLCTPQPETLQPETRNPPTRNLPTVNRQRQPKNDFRPEDDPGVLQKLPGPRGCRQGQTQTPAYPF